MNKIFTIILISLFLIGCQQKLVNVNNQSTCVHDQFMCEAAVNWGKYKDLRVYEVTFVANLNDGETRSHILNRTGNNLAMNKLYLNNKLTSQSIYTNKLRYELDLNTGKYITKDPLPSSDFDLYEDDTVGYSRTSPTQKLVAFIMEHNQLFSFQEKDEEKCEVGLCKKFDVTIAENIDKQGLIDSGMDQYSAENLFQNKIEMWFDKESKKVHRIKTIYKEQYRDLTYNYNPPKIEIPE